MVTHSRPYRGRFAPSPTGPLHAGSLFTALASFLDARQAQGTWLVRIEDLDPPREQPGAAAAILRSLEAHGLHWDESVWFQSQRLEHYQHTLSLWEHNGLIYRCQCNRKRLTQQQGYDRLCFHNPPLAHTPCALRAKLPDLKLSWQDIWCAGQTYQPNGQDDFVVRRKDGLHAYQLAVAIDDVAQGISCIIRGRDLLECTGRQWTLHHWMDAECPEIGHLPLICAANGQKLSKQNHAPALQDERASENLLQALTALRLPPPPTLRGASCCELLQWAIPQWRRDRLHNSWEFIPLLNEEGASASHSE